MKNFINKLNNEQNEINNNDNINNNNNPIKLTTEDNILNNNLQSQEDIHQINQKINKTKKNMRKKGSKKLNNRKLKFNTIPRNIGSSKEKDITVSCESISSERNGDKKKESEKNKEAFEKKKLYIPEYEKYNDLDYEDALNYDKR